MNIVFYMKDSLEELKFNFDTVLYLKQLGWTQTKMMEYFVNKLNYPSSTVNTLLTLKTSYLNSVFKRLELYVDMKLSNDEVKLHMSKYKNLESLVNYLLDTCEEDNDKIENTQNNEASDADDVKKKVLEVKEVVEKVDDENEDDNEETNDLDVVEEDEEDESNVFEKFLKENVENTDNDKDKIKSSQVYSKFKKWFSSNYDDETPSKVELKSFLNDKLGKSVKSVWTGASLK